MFRDGSAALRAALRAVCLRSGFDLPTGEGWQYLAAEMKLASRRIVG